MSFYQNDVYSIRVNSVFNFLVSLYFDVCSSGEFIFTFLCSLYYFRSLICEWIFLFATPECLFVTMLCLYYFDFTLFSFDCYTDLSAVSNNRCVVILYLLICKYCYVRKPTVTRCNKILFCLGDVVWFWNRLFFVVRVWIVIKVLWTLLQYVLIVTSCPPAFWGFELAGSFGFCEQLRQLKRLESFRLLGLKEQDYPFVTKPLRLSLLCFQIHSPELKLVQADASLLFLLMSEFFLVYQQNWYKARSKHLPPFPLGGSPGKGARTAAQRAVTSAEVLGTISKNNLRGITFGIQTVHSVSIYHRKKSERIGERSERERERSGEQSERSKNREAVDIFE